MQSLENNQFRVVTVSSPHHCLFSSYCTNMNCKAMKSQSMWLSRLLKPVNVHDPSTLHLFKCKASCVNLWSWHSQKHAWNLCVLLLSVGFGHVFGFWLEFYPCFSLLCSGLPLGFGPLDTGLVFREIYFVCFRGFCQNLATVRWDGFSHVYTDTQPWFYPYQVHTRQRKLVWCILKVSPSLHGSAQARSRFINLGHYYGLNCCPLSWSCIRQIVKIMTCSGGKKKLIISWISTSLELSASSHHSLKLIPEQDKYSTQCLFHQVNFLHYDF